MSETILEFDRVYKKFKRGEIYDSLRDLIPAVTGRMFRRDRSAELESREFWALQDVSFSLDRGEAFGIVGHNGAGKSTFLKFLTRILKPTAGRFRVSGRLSALIEVGAGFHMDLTGRENIYLNGAILGMSRDEIKSKFDRIVDFSGIEQFIDTPVKRYSSGMYARLGFSVAAHVDPDVLIVDEVLSVGDFLFQRKCIERMRSVIESGATVVFVSHNLQAVSELCGRSLLFDHGRVLEVDDTNAVIKAYLDKLYEGRHDGAGKTVYIKAVSMRNEAGPCVRFSSMERAWIDIDVVANEAVEEIAVVIAFRDDSQFEVFNTSTVRLGEAPLRMRAGESRRVTYEVNMNFAFGSFNLGVWLHRYDLGKEMDSWYPATSAFVAADIDVRGAVNLEPKIVRD